MIQHTMTISEYLTTLRELRMSGEALCLILTPKDFLRSVDGYANLDCLLYTMLDVQISDKVIVLGHQTNTVLKVLKERNPGTQYYQLVSRPNILLWDEKHVDFIK